MKLVILDRDGVINQDSDAFIKSVAEWIPIPGSLDAIARLKQAGYRVAVATNQSGLARGYFDVATLQAIHDELQRLLAQRGTALDAIVWCPHAPEDKCDCRKPLPGLLRQIGEILQVDPATAVVVGDSLRDLQSAQAIGATAVLVLTGKGQQTLLDDRLDPSIPVYANLASCVDALLSGELLHDQATQG